MGDRGWNAGGWAYMPRVWCPACGWSFLVGNGKFDEQCSRDSKRPMMRCSNLKKCEERRKRKKRK